ncbi:interferon-induced protein 44-like [Dicentrarchus labrax]|uniref:interferon-induced protein 44-like n=1 Tax=Dicentrarchus labrax TaxID=13489 RepID=UPI0021F56A02|nr:interferon-induced protein 44-like [Dicentrarchus labrax]
MGNYFFKPAPPPSLSEPWREINWGERQSALKSVQDYKPRIKGQHLRILLHGPVGAGKSSFINSVISVLEVKMRTLAVTESTSTDCCTKKYTTYKIQKGSPDAFYPLVLNDMSGVKNGTRRNRKIHVKDVTRLMKGHVKDGYTFNPECKISKDDQHYNTSPTVNDKVHVLVSVIDASKVSLMSHEVLEVMLDIREEAKELGIPHVAILTQIDQACPEIQKDIKNVYRSIKLREKMEQFSVNSGIPLNSIFPVKNYHDEIDLNGDVDSLILSALRSIINIGEDFLNRKNT